MLSVENKSIVLSVVVLSVIILSVVILSVVILTVVAPCIRLEVAPMLLATGLAGLGGLAGLAGLAWPSGLARVDSGASSNMRVGKKTFHEQTL